ncbi:hypothetical protein [Amycolatopsis sp. cmx-11-32]|uniref:hypothetical protein n=1 Tax=Amycolatopsis sp. cmx-11-32 TaxID=2785796 RepID=UPI0039E3F8D2
MLFVVVEPHIGMLVNASTFVAAAILVLVGVRSRPAASSRSTSGDGDPGAVGQRGKLFVLYGLV